MIDKAIVGLLLYVMSVGCVELAMMLLMTVKVTMLKMTHQEKAAAAQCAKVWDATGQYTPNQVYTMEVKRIPYWLTVWPRMAERGRRLAVDLTFMIKGFGMRRKMGFLRAIGITTMQDATGRSIVRDAYRDAKKLVIVTAESIKEVKRLN